MKLPPGRIGQDWVRWETKAPAQEFLVQPSMHNVFHYTTLHYNTLHYSAMQNITPLNEHLQCRKSVNKHEKY